MTETPNPHIVDTDTLTGEMHPIRRCVLAIGSNLGERLNNLQGAVNSLADTPEVWVTAVSPVYETAPVDAPEGSKDFLNAVVLADTTLSARTLLERALAVEDAYGRERTDEPQRPAHPRRRPDRRRGPARPRRRPGAAAPQGPRARLRARPVARRRARRRAARPRAGRRAAREGRPTRRSTRRDDLSLNLRSDPPVTRRPGRRGASRDPPVAARPDHRTRRGRSAPRSSGWCWAGCCAR